MDAGPKVNPPPAGPSREALEDLVYRPGLGDRVLPAPSPWLTVPVTLAVAGVLGAMAFLLGRRNEAGKRVLPTVDVVLQEAPVAAVHAPAAPAPAPRPPAPAPAAAPAPQAPSVAPPVEPRQEAPPEAVPKELPKEDLSRQGGGSAGPGAWSGPGPGGAGGVPGGTGGGAGAAGKILDLDISQVKEKSRPPELVYPPLARSARIQGTVVVQIIVGLDGVPVTARALEGPSQLRAAAEAWALGWRFFPYLQGGVPMVSRYKLSITFRIK